MPVGIRVDSGPVGQLHILISDDCIEDESSDKLGELCFIRQAPDMSSHVGVAVALLFSFGRVPLYLIEIFDMDAPSLRKAVKSRDVRGISPQLSPLFPNATRLVLTEQANLRHLYADLPRELNHGVFVFGQVSMFRGRKFTIQYFALWGVGIESFRFGLPTAESLEDLILSSRGRTRHPYAFPGNRASPNQA